MFLRGLGRGVRWVLGGLLVVPGGGLLLVSLWSGVINRHWSPLLLFGVPGLLLLVVGCLIAGWYKEDKRE